MNCFVLIYIYLSYNSILESGMLHNDLILHVLWSDHHHKSDNNVKLLVHSLVGLFVILWTVACQAFLTMRFSRQKYWSVFSFPPPGDLPDPGFKPMSPASPALAGKFFPGLPPGKPSQFGTQVMYQFPLFLASFVESSHFCWFFCSIQYSECVLLSCLSC
jgi:hypothetical protein